MQLSLIYKDSDINKRPTNRKMGKGRELASCRNGQRKGPETFEEMLSLISEKKNTLTPRYHWSLFGLSHFDHTPCSNTLLETGAPMRPGCLWNSGFGEGSLAISIQTTNALLPFLGTWSRRIHLCMLSQVCAPCAHIRLLRKHCLCLPKTGPNPNV